MLNIEARKVIEGIQVGDSISVNGTCLTAIKIERDTLAFEVIPQTLKATNLGILRLADKVNLERSLRVGDRLSGHFVNGHIDCLGIIRRKNYRGGNLCFEITVPAEFSKYCHPKGSIAVDGVSLTIQKASSNTFSVYIIPHTLKNTALNFRRPADKVNIEFDVLAKKAA